MTTVTQYIWPDYYYGYLFSASRWDAGPNRRKVEMSPELVDRVARHEQEDLAVQEELKKIYDDASS